MNAFIRKLAAPQREKIEARATELIAEEMEVVKKATGDKSVDSRLGAPQ